jgi:predicted small lipoprotein YifL
MGVIPRVVVAVMFLASLAGCGRKDQSAGDEKTRSGVEQALTRAASQPATDAGRQVTVQVEISPALSERGVYRTTARFTPPTMTLEVQLVARNGFKGRLVARGVDKMGHETGQGSASVDIQPGGSAEVTFAVAGDSPGGRVEEYILQADE